MLLVRTANGQSDEGRTLRAAPINPVLLPAGHLTTGLDHVSEAGARRRRATTILPRRGVAARAISASVDDYDTVRNAVAAKRSCAAPRR